MLIVQFDELGEVTLKCRNKVLKFVDLFSYADTEIRENQKRPNFARR